MSIDKSNFLKDLHFRRYTELISKTNTCFEAVNNLKR